VTETTSRTDLIARGRQSFQRRAWGDAFAELSAADRETPLDAADIDRLAIAAHLTGRDAESTELWARAHHQFLQMGDAQQAARCACIIGHTLFLRGEHARSGGWLARARRVIEEAHCDSVVVGWLMLPAAIRCVMDGDAPGAYAAFQDATAIGARFADHDLVTMARMGQGRALIAMGRIAEGIALLDESMVAVTGDEVSPMVAGAVYCSVIEACHDTFDLGRAQEWTEALAAWCAAQPGLVPYQGECLVRRAEILQLRGTWPDALQEVRRACEILSQPPPKRAVGAALYQQGELHRVRGELANAEEAYRHASHVGRSPQPGLALLRLAQGQVDAARAAIQQAIDGARDQRMRSRMLGAYVEIMLAAGEVGRARAAADELAALATTWSAPFLRATAAHAFGLVLHAEGQPQAALAPLRDAAEAWRDLGAPYEEARARAALGLAHRARGDEDTALLELDAARHAFHALGAAVDLARVKSIVRAPAPAGTGGLTARELEVLTLVATGKTNRMIAGELDISEKTVARHVANIFLKLGLSSRAAATAYVYRHDLLASRT
jgi:DNA-binding CsgD family transcriptional regulator